MNSSRGEIISTVLLMGALVAIVGSLIGAGSQILNSSAYAPVPRVERTAEKTTLSVTVISANQISITGNLCFGAGLGSGIEKTTLWASDDPPGKHVISNVLAQTFNGGSGDYPAPCIRPDFEGDAILTNAKATPSRFFSLSATLSAPLTDKCVDVYLHLYSNRQGRWPNFRRFKVNKDGLCMPKIVTPTSNNQPTTVPSERPTVTPPIPTSPSLTPPISLSPTRPLSITPSPTPKPGICGQPCGPGQSCAPGLSCITDLCNPPRPNCRRTSVCIPLLDIKNPGARCPRPTSTPTPPLTSSPSLTPPISPSPTPPLCIINSTGWLDNNRSRFTADAWTKKHQYADCPSDNNGFWPLSALDCLIADQGSGPSAADRAIVKDPTPLYYKHLTPIDLFSIIPLGSVRTLQRAVDDEVKRVIREAIVNAVKKNPARFADISFDSVSVGMEGGRDGEIMRSISLWVHPVVESIISDAISTQERARLFYQPYIEGAIGENISTEDAEELYVAALNHCGSSAQGGVQSGLGVRKVFGEYTAVVQNWVPGGSSEDDIFSDFKDCNIHVVRTTMCVPSPTPTQPVPTGDDSKPNISGKITLNSCIKPEVMYVSRCEKGGKKSDCKDVVQDDTTVTTPADDSIWLDQNASNPGNNLYVFNYRIVTDSQRTPLETGEAYQVPMSLMKVGLRGFFSQRETEPVIASGRRDFTITVPASECGPTPTVRPTDAPRCIFNPISYVKIRENGIDRLFTEAASDGAQWSTMNNKRVDKFGDALFYRTPFQSDGQHQPCGEQGCDLTGKRWCCVDDNDTPGDSYDLSKKPYDIASVYLYYPKDKFKIVAKCDHTGKCTDVDEDDPNANRVDNLPIGCNQIYKYGWVVERKPAASCSLAERCAPRLRDITPDDVSASSVKIRWDEPDEDCDFNAYDLDIIEPTGNGISVCQIHDINASKGSTRCHLKYDAPTSKEGAKTRGTWLRDVPYTIVLRTVNNDVPDCRSVVSQKEFVRESEPETPDKKYNTFALNLYDMDEFEPGGDNHLCWTVGNNDNKDNIRKSDYGGFICDGNVERDPTTGKVTHLVTNYTNNTNKMAWVVWQLSRCEESDENCQKDNTGPDGDRVEEANDSCGIPQGKTITARWDVKTLKPTKVDWSNDLGSCVRDGDDDPQGDRRRKNAGQQVIPPFPPSKLLAPQGVGPIGYAQGYPDFQRTDDGKLVLNGIYINDITQDPLSTDSEGNLVIAQEPDYRISFLPKHDSQFLIDILGSPFDEVRTKAEDHFVELLGIDKPDACWLYTVESTPDTVNPAESKKNYMLSFCEYRLRADINGDTVINAIDYALLAQKIGETAYTGREDINEDGSVDGLDVSIVVDNFGRKVE